MMAVLIATSWLLLTAYIVYAVYLTGIPTSVSDTYYQLKKANKPQWLFQIAMIIPAMLLLPAWLEVSRESLQFAAFLTCGALMFVGAAPSFKLGLEGRVHYISSLIAAGSSLVWLILSGVWLPFVIISVLSAVFCKKYGQPLFWAEIAAFAGTYAGVFCIYAERL